MTAKTSASVAQGPQGSTASSGSPGHRARPTGGLATKAPIHEPLESAWRRSDALFGLLHGRALLERPIRLRQPFLFYLGHLPAFAWNHLGLGALGRAPFRPDFDALFARGIDPPDTGDGPEDAAWPALDEVLAYRDRVRDRLRPALDDEGLETTALMVLEHELMHHETLLYMLLPLPPEAKRPPRGFAPAPPGAAAPRGRVGVPRGRARLGTARGAIPFGWDNEFPRLEVEVPAFTIDRTPVRNGEFLEFVHAGGYGERRLWSDEAWSWLERRGRRHPPFWQETPHGWLVRTAFADVPFERAAEWPVYATWAEARAFATFQGRRLPTEAEYDRAAYGAPGGRWRLHPWGDEAPRDGHGNFGFRHWAPTPAGSHPDGASAWGVLDLVGNGWEWTSTVFGPFTGFEPLPSYPGYSADFFDGRHYVLKGASWATDDGLVRRSFRNWFQPHYPYVFAQFRCAGA